MTPRALAGYRGARVEASPQPLRPLTFGQVLDVGFKITFRNLGQLLLTVAVVVVPVQIIAALVQFSALPAAFDVSQQQALTGGAQQTPQVDTDAAVLGLVGILVANLFSAAAGLLATAACFKAVSDAYLGERARWRSSLRFAFSRLGRILWIGVLLGLSYLLVIVLGGFLGGFLAALTPFLLLLVVPALLIGGVYLWTRWTVAVPALLVEDARGFRAFGRSWALVGNDRWWFTCGINVIGFLIALLLGLVLGVVAGVPALLDPTNLLLNLGTSVLVNIIALTLTTPIIAAFTIVLYFDHRVRREGFDLELLARRIGTAPGGAAPPPGASQPSPSPGASPPPPAPAPQPGSPESWPPPQGPPGGPERPDRGPAGG